MDDTAKTSLVANRVVEYQEIDTSEEWVNKWRIKINTEKTQAIAIGRRNKRDQEGTSKHMGISSNNKRNQARKDTE